jgi:hypothetical protein
MLFISTFKQIQYVVMYFVDECLILPNIYNCSMVFRMIEESPDVWNSTVINPCATCPENTTNIYPELIQFFGVDQDGKITCIYFTGH